jgi:hypothetical protein
VSHISDSMKQDVYEREIDRKAQLNQTDLRTDSNTFESRHTIDSSIRVRSEKWRKNLKLHEASRCRVVCASGISLFSFSLATHVQISRRAGKTGQKVIRERWALTVLFQTITEIRISRAGWIALH